MIPAVQKYLKQIEAGNPVNWKKIERALIKIGIPSALLNQAFDVLPYGKDTYQVTVCDDYAFTEIRSLLNKPRNNDRTSASVAGNSHAVSVRGAMLITWAADEESPKVRVFNDAPQTQLPAKPNVLIIENEECFLNKEDTFQFLDTYCGIDCPITDIEFIFGSGNSISNKRILPYLKSAEKIYCLFDVDFGGLRIFTNLLAGGLSADRTHYLIPSDLEYRLQQSKRIATQAELDNLAHVYGVSTKTDRIISAIRYYKTTLEQESYRAEL
uniref:Wadjet protein JetD C-terminal domain-containing protein n=1 Tax=Rheinheimera sp. BAL341 TaxID=1708203 RepID=A0A486XX01_9GAMM